MLANLISHTLIRRVGKIKIENFHSRIFTCLIYTDCIGRHGTPSLRLTSLNVMTSLNVTVLSYNMAESATELTALSKTHFQKWNVCKKKNMGERTDPFLEITVWHHSTSLVMPASNPRNGIFYRLLTPMKDSYILTHQRRKSWILPWGRNSYPTQGKKFIENSHVFDIHWLYRTPSLRLTSLDVITSVNVTGMSSQYGGHLQSKWLNY